MSTRADIWRGFSAEERAFAEKHGRREDASEVWRTGPLAAPSQGHFLCDECQGTKRCDDAPHPYCNGWCHYCGGAGQLPIHPGEAIPHPPHSECRYPRPMLFDVAYVRLRYIRECLRNLSDER